MREAEMMRYTLERLERHEPMRQNFGRPTTAIDPRAIDTARFWAKVNKDGPRQPHMPTPCWEWTGAPGPGGYGRFRLEGRRTVAAHRASWALVTGEDPGRFSVCHACDYPRCVRVDHLFLATPRGNSQDAAAKGHMGPRRFRAHVPAVPSGTRAEPAGAGAHLHDALAARGVTAYALARAIGVQPTEINDVLRGFRRLTARTALLLGRCFGTSPEYWMGLQSRYELDVARDEIGDALEKVDALPPVEGVTP